MKGIWEIVDLKKKMFLPLKLRFQREIQASKHTISTYYDARERELLCSRKHVGEELNLN